MSRDRLTLFLSGGFARNIFTLFQIAAAVAVALFLISLPFRRAQQLLRPSARSMRQTYQAREIHLTGVANSGVSAVNQRGEAVGTAWDDDDSPFHPFVWRNGKATALPLPPDCADALAFDINDKGAIVGAALLNNGEVRGVLWEGGKITLFGVAGRSILAQSINEAGVIAGIHAERRCGAPPSAFLWRDGKFRDLGAFQASGINAANEVAGIKVTEGDELRIDAIVWRDNKGLEILAKPQGYDFSVALGLNNTGQVIGVVAKEDGTPQAVLWNKGRPRLLSEKPSIVYAINDNGQSVGLALREQAVEAFLWDGATEIPLNDSLRDGKEWILLAARGINKTGQIVGTGIHDGKIRGFLLTQ